MPTLALIGAQWGDEGKGKIIDAIAENAHVIARYQGGPNAGHTVVVGKEKHIFHHIPSGILRPGKRCIIGDGMVVDLPTLVKEIDGLLTRGISIEGRLFISERAHLVLPYHRALDVEAEKHKAGNRIGTTGRGIGPVYSDKVARTGLRMIDLLNEKRFGDKLQCYLEEKNTLLQCVYKIQGFSYPELYKEYISLGQRILPHITDTGHMLRQAMARHENILLEGAQGTMLDVDQGTYPFVTSSNTTAGGACTGLGIPPRSIDRVIGVMKAYTTRVGMGPFPTELNDNIGQGIRERGNEYGSTTGRPRRCGWFDVPVVRRAIELNGIEELAVTKLDVLDQCETVHICTAYRIEDTTVNTIPADANLLSRCQPVYESMLGWRVSTAGLKTEEQLPKNAADYLKRIEELLQVRIALISTGAERGDTICKGFSWPS